MEDCSQYCIESESGEFITNVSLTTDINPSLYIDRYVEVEGEEIMCTECTSIEVNQIVISSDCNIPTSCFVDPCETAPDCQLNNTVECIPNYCGGCYADFYDLDGNLVDCNIPTYEDCLDLGGLFFGVCDMFLGFSFINGNCNGISGCSWEIDEIDYSQFFFESLTECESVCTLDLSCDEISLQYESLHFNQYAECEYDNDCVAVWGDCEVGLGGCHYSVNSDNYPENNIETLVNLWNENDCMSWVCDCSPLPYPQCIDGTCISAYCMDNNPAGCYETGCDEGYECIQNPNDCVPSQCYCDGFYGDWFCTEDCGGGTCNILSFLNGDVNYDGFLNVADIILIINMILEITEINFDADMNNDGMINIIDIVTVITIILNR